MSGRTIERHRTIEYDLAEERKALREIQEIREQQANERVQDRVLRFEDSNGTKIVSYSEISKETVYRDPEGKEDVDIQDLSIDEKNELDTMYEIVTEYEEMTLDELREFEEEKEMDVDFLRDEQDEIDIDRDDDMEL